MCHTGPLRGNCGAVSLRSLSCWRVRTRDSYLLWHKDTHVYTHAHNTHAHTQHKIPDDVSFLWLKEICSKMWGYLHFPFSLCSIKSFNQSFQIHPIQLLRCLIMCINFCCHRELYCWRIQYLSCSMCLNSNYVMLCNCEIQSRNQAAWLRRIWGSGIFRLCVSWGVTKWLPHCAWTHAPLQNFACRVFQLLICISLVNHTGSYFWHWGGGKGQVYIASPFILCLNIWELLWMSFSQSSNQSPVDQQPDYGQG